MSEHLVSARPKTAEELIGESRSASDADEYLKIEKVLAGIQPGYSVVVSRVHPSWARGFLERMECDTDQSLDLGYLAETWGGQVLRIRVCDGTGTYRGGADIPFRSYPVKFWGKQLRRDGDSLEGLPPGTTTAIAPIAPPPQQRDSLSIVEVLKFFRQARSEDMAAYQAIAGNLKKDSPVVGGGIQNILDFAQQYKQLKEVFGSAEESFAGKGNEDMALMATIGDVAKALFAKSPAPPGYAAPITMPAPPPIQNPTQRQSPGTEVSRTAQPAVNMMDIASQLSTLDPAAAADVALLAMARMPEAKRSEMIELIMTRLGGELGLDSDDDDEVFSEDDDPYPDDTAVSNPR